MFMRNIFRVSGLLDKIKIAVTPELKINLKFNRGQFFLDNNKKWTTWRYQQLLEEKHCWEQPAVEDHKRTICGEKTHKGEK